MGMMTNLGDSKKIRGVIVGLVVLGLVGSLLAALAAVVPATPAAAASLSTTGELTENNGYIRMPGETLNSERWTLDIDPVKYRQNKAVLEADPLNFLPSNGFQWLTAKVRITSNREEVATPGWMRVTLIADRIRMSHKVRITDHYPSQPLPNELDVEEMQPGETRTGTIGWMIPGDISEEDGCLLRVSLGGQESVYSCFG